MKKTCTICKAEKPLSEFNKNKGRKDGLQTKCRECSRQKSKEYYQNNPDRIIELNRINKAAHRQKLFEFLANYFKQNHCVDCGEKDIRVLEFDHKDSSQKSCSISTMVASSRSLDSIKKEILKCDVRCANCHKKRTAKQFDTWRHKWFSKDS